MVRNLREERERDGGRVGGRKRGRERDGDRDRDRVNAQADLVFLFLF